MAQLSHYQSLGSAVAKCLAYAQDKGSVAPEKRRKKLFTQGLKRSNKDSIVSFYPKFGRGTQSLELRCMC